MATLAPPTDAHLDAMQWVADPLADRTVAALLGPYDPSPQGQAARLARADALNAVIRSWKDNAHIGVPNGAAPKALNDFLAQGAVPPPWRQPERIARAEKLFMDHGALSVTILFCASLPECYVVPDLAAVLHATGQLEDRAEHRIRTTGAMIFPVMMNGGLTTPQGAGIAQVLKVRLIHASIRNLILRENPEVAIATMRSDAGPAVIPMLEKAATGHSMAQALHVHGWDLTACGAPNNQEELAYTLLTFSYVFLRGMRRLGIGFTRDEEEDYLHAWNVAGHHLGIDRSLMVDTYDQAEALFFRMQARGRQQVATHMHDCDPRAALGKALMAAMQSVFPPGAAKSFPVLLTRRLMEPESARDLGLDGQVSWAARTLFSIVMGTARGIDAIGRLFMPQFSLSRLLTRAIGYRLTCTLLMSQTLELSVPATLRPGIKAMIASWGEDAKAGPKMNAFEDRLTTPGNWDARHRPVQ